MTIDPTAAAPTPPAPAAAQPANAPEIDWQARAAKAEADLETWKGHSRTWEQRAKENGEARTEADKAKAALTEFAKQLGIVEDKPDPEALTRQLAAATAERQQLARERAVLLAASTQGADAAALLDSRAFLATLDAIDPADSAAVTAAVKAAVEGSDRYKLATPTNPAPQPPAPTPPAPRQASSPGQFNGSPGQPRPLGAADFQNMSGQQLHEAMKAGLFDGYLNSPNA